MAEDSSKSLVHITKAADTLIKKIDKAVGGIFRPHQIMRVAKAEAAATIIKAKAEAETALIKTQSDIDTEEIKRRALHRFVEEEARHQVNMEAIAEKAVHLLTEGADADAVEDDWVTNFFDKSRIVSDEQMRQIWSRVLAGEVNAPGTFSRRTVNLLGDLDKSDCQAFSTLCRFCWTFEEHVPLIFDINDQIYLRHGITFKGLVHLDNIQLIRLAGPGVTHTRM